VNKCRTTNLGEEDEPFKVQTLKELYKAKGRIINKVLLITGDNRVLDLESEEGKAELQRIFACAAKDSQSEQV
jgi:hypothetical protein